MVRARPADAPIQLRRHHVTMSYCAAVALAGMVATWARMEVINVERDKRLAAVEATTANIATKADVQAVGQRVDRVMELLVEDRHRSK